MIHTAGRMGTKKARFNFFFMGIFFAVMTFFYAVLLPMQAEIAALHQTLAAEKSKLAAIDFFLTAHPNVAEYEQEINGKLMAVNRKLPDDAALGEFIQMIEVAAVKANVIILEIKPQKDIHEDVYTELPLKLSVKGDYWQTLLFYRQLEMLDRFNCVKKFSVKAEEGSLLCEIMVSIFYYKEVKLSEKQENHSEVSNHNDE